MGCAASTNAVSGQRREDLPETALQLAYQQAYCQQRRAQSFVSSAATEEAAHLPQPEHDESTELPVFEAVLPVRPLGETPVARC